MAYDDSYIDSFRRTANELSLEGCELLNRLSNKQIRENINGIGSAGMNGTLRHAIDRLNPSLVYASHLHDLFWTFQASGDDADFYTSNEQFQSNGIKMAKFLHGWYSPLRYLAILQAWQFRRILDDFGWSAYITTPHKDV